MAGQLAAERERTRSSDILFDLTPEDDKKLLESDLLDLINYGQVKKPIKVPGANGRTYEMELALLWDEDKIDILKKTMDYASDPILRNAILRRLKLYKAIQRIDKRDYSDPDNVSAKRELWAILSRLSDAQVEYLDTRYIEIELGRNMQMIDAVKALSGMFEEHEQKTTDQKIQVQTNADEHLATFQADEVKREAVAEELAEVITKDQIGAKEPEKSEEKKSGQVKSPRQDGNKVS